MSLRVVHGRGGAQDRPFFSQQPEDICPSAVPKLPVPSVLQDIYKSEDGEFYVGARTFMSPATILKHHDFLKENGQTRIVAFAFTYVGMGRIQLDVYDPQSHSVFTLQDGGGSGIERAHNIQRRVSLNVDEMSLTPFDSWWKQRCDDQENGEVA